MINIQNLASKKKCFGVNFKDGTETELCLKPWFENGRHFYDITESGWFRKRLLRNKVPNNHFLKSV